MMSSLQSPHSFDNEAVRVVQPPSPADTGSDHLSTTCTNSPELVTGLYAGVLSSDVVDLPNMPSASPLMCGDMLDVGGSDTDCPYCHKPFRQPRVLNCLHSLCEDCVIALLEGRREVDLGKNDLDCELEPSHAPETKPPPGVVRCPVCREDSQVGNDASFVRAMLVDFVRVNLQDRDAMQQDGMHCESCKAKDNAIARCADCCSFLCKNCVQAHEYMRCFDGHKVVSLQEMKATAEAGEPLLVHRPIVCPSHPTEPLKFFCITDDSPVCQECVLTSHKYPDHRTIHADDPKCDAHLKQELQNIVNACKQKEQFCDQASVDYSTHIATLTESRKAAEEQIALAFDAYRQMLDARQSQLVKHLDALCVQQEQTINSSFKNLQCLSQKISDACRFGERLEKYGSPMEILVSRKAVLQQLTALCRKAQCPNVSVSLKYSYDPNQFTQALHSFTGQLHADNNISTPSTPSGRGVFHSTPNEVLNQLVPEVPMQHQQYNPPPNGTMSQYAGVPHQQHSAQLAAAMAYPPPSMMKARAQTDAYTANLMAMINLHGGNVESAVAPQRPMSRTSSAASSHSPPSLFAPPTSSTLNQQYAVLNTDGGWGGQPAGNGLGPQHPQQGVILPGQGPPTSPLNGVQGMAAAGLEPLTSPPPTTNPSKMSSMQVKCKFGSLGAGPSQFNSPHGFCLGFDDEIIVADTNNHRIQVFCSDGTLVHQFGVAGKEDGGLWYPRKVATLNTDGAGVNRYLVCDRGVDRSRMQIFNRRGEFIKKIAIRFIDIVAGVCVDKDGCIVAVDSVNPTVFRMSEDGHLSKWFDCSEHMREPSDIAVFNSEYYICDFKGHCVSVFDKEGVFSRRIGNENITSFPNGIDISDMGDVVIGDSHGNRFHVAVFRNEGALQSEFECSGVKVSRCCGLRITSRGLIVTLAKNNHQVLVLNTLYVA